MNAAMKRRIALVGLAMGVVFGCAEVANQPGGGAASDNEPTEGMTIVDSGFSTAPVSPGGTGGVGTVQAEEVNDRAGDETRSFFTAYQIDPEAEDSAGPKFVVAGDLDKDGLLDLASGWNQSQPVQLHLQQRDAADNISFRTVTLAGTTPVAVIAGIQFGQINDDNGDGAIDDSDWLDVVVLSKGTGYVTFCPPKSGEDPKQISLLDGEILIYLNPANVNLIADGDAWSQDNLVNPFIADVWIHDQYPGRTDGSYEEDQTVPEKGGFTSLVVANIDGQDGDDILVALNPGECETLGQKPPINTVDLWTNPGPGLATSWDLWGAPPPDGQSRNVPITLLADAPAVKDLGVMDIDDDGDLDVIATFTIATSSNVRWARNPFVPHTTGGTGGYGAVIAGASDTRRFYATDWEERPIGQVDTGADIMALGDVDSDGHDDIVIRSTNGQIVQFFRHPNPLVVPPEFPPNDAVPSRLNFPWPVFTLSEFDGQEPEAVAIGDVTGDNQVELAIAAQGAVFWYDGTIGETIYDPWFPNTIIQDQATGAADPTQAPGSGVGVTDVDTNTHINKLLIVDLDGDGKSDIVGTLDRRSGAGLSDDRIVWYRNTKTEE
ncbi:MAG: hypothetical protein KJ749_00770 [Planctomycetes bacterium]|nr:hypothetical protein [Planctomycetota bacterium]